MWFSLLNRGIRVFCHLREMQVTRRGCSKYVFVLLVFMTVTMMAAGKLWMPDRKKNHYIVETRLVTSILCSCESLQKIKGWDDDQDMGTCRSFTIDFSVQVPWIHHWYVYSCLQWSQNIRDCQRKMQSEKSRTPDFCVKPDIHSHPHFLTRIVTASVIFPSTSVCTGVRQHTVSGRMTKMAAYSELGWYVWSSIAQHQSQMYFKSMIKL
jgi:hypothetical protein